MILGENAEKEILRHGWAHGAAHWSAGQGVLPFSRSKTLK